METTVFDRATSEIYIEKQYKDKSLRFLYNTFLGRVFLKLFVASKTFSRISALADNKPGSLKKIQPFIEEYQIDMRDYLVENYRCFNDFFTRRILPDARPFSKNSLELIAVADSKLSSYKIDGALKLRIKGCDYTVGELLKDPILAESYKNGLCLIFRLTVDDYHRYCFVDQGVVKETKVINGLLHTVGPLSNRFHQVYNENNREYSILTTENFGDVIQMEVGALLVGKINNHPKKAFEKGEEKGYFALGGSTVVLLFKENTVKIHEDIVGHSNQGIESKVKMGETIGVGRNDWSGDT